MIAQPSRRVALVTALLALTGVPPVLLLLAYGMSDWAVVCGAIDIVAIAIGVLIFRTMSKPPNTENDALTSSRAEALASLRVLQVCAPVLVVGGGTWAVLLLLEIGDYEGTRRTVKILQFLFALIFVGLGLYYYVVSIRKLKRQIVEEYRRE